MLYVICVVIRTHDGPKNHVFPHVYTPYLVLSTTVCFPVILIDHTDQEKICPERSTVSRSSSRDR